MVTMSAQVMDVMDHKRVLGLQDPSVRQVEVVLEMTKYLREGTWEHLAPRSRSN